MSGGALDASATLDEVLNVVSSKRVPLAPELAGYLVLEIAEHADPNGGDVEPQSVYIGEEGTVALVKPRRERPTGDAEASVRGLLGRLLEASGSQTPALAAASKRTKGPGLPALAEELEAALIPVNRAAGRRALARLAREVRRVTLGVGRHTLPSSSSLRSSLDGTSAAPPQKAASAAHWSEMPTAQFSVDPRPPTASETDVDSLIDQFSVTGETSQHARALKAMAGLDPTPAAPPEMARGKRADSLSGESDVEALLAMNSEPPGPLPPPTPPPRPGATHADDTSKAAAARGRPHGNERQLPTQPSQLKKGRATLPSAPHVPSRRGSWALLLVLVALGAGAYGVWRLRPDLVAPRVPGATAASSMTPSREGLPPCVGTLVVSDVPARAEVLLGEGQAPVEVPRMPVGARLEFVATAEGFVPKRVVIPAGAAWDTGPDGKPRFEAAVQLDPSRARTGTSDAWPAGEPGSAVGGQGPPGSVRVVSMPRGAEVWMLGGIGPEARIEQLRCDQGIEILLAGPTTYRKRLRVGAGDFVPDDNPGAGSRGGRAHIARVSAK